MKMLRLVQRTKPDTLSAPGTSEASTLSARSLTVYCKRLHYRKAASGASRAGQVVFGSRSDLGPSISRDILQRKMGLNLPHSRLYGLHFVRNTGFVSWC